MSIKLKARQISHLRPLPVFTRYQIPRDRLHADSAFADAIIAKYTASEGLELPSVSFVYPEMNTAAEESLDRLSSQLITLNRIRIQMNVYNQQWLHQYALTLSNSCELLLRQLKISLNASMTQVSRSSVHELEHILYDMKTAAETAGSRELIRESEIRKITEEKRKSSLSELVQLKEKTDRAAAREASQPLPDRANNAVVKEQTELDKEESETVLKILTAASRGNKSRERYMSELHKRLHESERGSGEVRSEILNRASTELLLLKDLRDASAPTVCGWASEPARQFFWRIQRAPEPARELFLQAAGYGTVVSLEKMLKTMNNTEFQHFSSELRERMQQLSEMHASSESIWSDYRFDYIDQQIEQISPEEWIALTELIEKEGLIFTDSEIVSRSEEDSQTLALEEGQELYWRTQQAAEQEEKLPHNPASEDRLRTQREIFLKELHSGSKHARVLEKALRTVTEQREVLTENRQIFNMLSESVLNMTQDEWQTFRNEITNINKSGIPGGISFAFLQNKDDTDTDAALQVSKLNAGELVLLNGSANTAANAAENADSSAGDTGRATQDATESALREAGIRMSREKTEFVRELRDLSRIPDSSMRSLERFLREHTVFRQSNPAEDGQHYLQKLSISERNNWHSFIMNLISAPNVGGTLSTPSGQEDILSEQLSIASGQEGILFEQLRRPSGQDVILPEQLSIPSEQVFLRIHTGSTGTILPLFKGDRGSRNIAIDVIERLREERVYTERQQAPQEELRDKRSADTFSYLLQGTRAAVAHDTAGEGNISSISNQEMELVQPEMEVPHRTESARREAEATRKTETESRRETVYRDIEFETSSYHTEEHTVREAAAGLGDVMDRLNQQQREIESIKNTQQKLAGRNVPRAILKKLDERAQMERLRGGR